MGRSLSLASPLLGLLCLAWPGADLAGQSLRLTVTDSAGGRPLAGAEVQMRTRGQAPRLGVTDSRGRIVFTVTAGDSVAVTVSLGGYQSVEGVVHIGAGERETAVAIALVADGQVLPEIGVTAPELVDQLERVGYRERQREEQGFFLDGAELEARASRASKLTDLMHTIPGVSAMIATTGRAGSLPHTTGMASFTRPCTNPKVLVDGLMILSDHQEYWGADRPDPSSSPLAEAVNHLEQVVHPKDVAAIEIYRRPAQVPERYGGAQSGCGVILIWSKRGLAEAAPKG